MLGTIVSGCGNSEGKQGVEKETGKQEQTTEIPSLVNEEAAPEEDTSEVKKREMNENLWVEITAQIHYLSEKYSDNQEKYAEEASDMMDEMGVTREQYSRYTEQLQKNESRYQRLSDRVRARLNELK